MQQAVYYRELYFLLSIGDAEELYPARLQRPARRRE